MAKVEEVTVKVKAETVVKPGYKTTEFYMTVAANIVSLLVLSGVLLPGSKWAGIVALIGAALTNMGYTAGRTNAKKNGNGQ